VRALAFLVHVFTALGAALALLALIAAVGGDWPMMFLWLGLALLIDGIDGTLARALRVADRVPRWSGEVLDLVVDFTTYVFVPAYAVAAAGLLAEPWNLAAAGAIVVSGALYFADSRMKTESHYFLGFPAVWNLVAFYLLLLRPSMGVTLSVVALLAILTFVPVRFVHPFRVRRLRSATLVLLLGWSALALWAVLDGLQPAPWVVTGLCALAIYFLLAGLVRSGRMR
jgi:phosphatidylcholine synthase